MASPYASAAKIASAEANLGGPIALDSSLLLKQLVVALGNVTGGGGGGSGTVTSVAQSFTGGLISVAGSPITTSGTLALTVAGTSGGIPYFSSASTWASSAALAANALVVGGGAGAAPSTVTTGTGVVTALGVNVGTAGAFVVNGGALGTPSSGTLTNCTGIPAAGITGTLPAANGGTGVANGASCTLTLPDAATTITTGGTIALGGFTLTVPATGTAALRGTTNSFTAVNTFAPTTPGSAVVITSGTVTTSLPFLTATQTWNGAGVTFTAASINVTNTSSATASKLLDLQLGGSTHFGFKRSGPNDGYPCFITAQGGFEFQSAYTGTLSFQLGNSNATIVGCGAPLRLGSAGVDYITLAGLVNSGNYSTNLSIPANNILEQRNSTTAQIKRVYNTYTSATSYERFSIDWATSANTCLVGTEKGSGGGTARNLAFMTDATTRMTIKASGVINVTGIPTSSSGLSAGDIYSNAGILTVV